ncbi:hypothetical protein HanIR_Chr17g0850341 [Helianthus annuus]|nr:hypothetical protein HanIR_Chr17g0850341 [Helianthus annuus]
MRNQSRALSGHLLDKWSALRVTRVHHQFPGKPGNSPARRHDSKITGKIRLAQGSNPGFHGSPIIAHQCLTLHQVEVEPASLKRNVSPPPLDLEIIGISSLNIHHTLLSLYSISLFLSLLRLRLPTIIFFFFHKP